jgi:hypothetical protein
MSRLPKYPFKVVTVVRNGDGLHTITHNYENLAGAMAYREIALAKPMTQKVEVCLIIDESVPAYDRPQPHNGSGRSWTRAPA